MNADLRACVAYTAGRGVSGKNFSLMFDCSRSRQLSMTGLVTSDHIDVYDDNQNQHLAGNSNGSKYALSYAGKNHPVTLEIKR